MLIYKVKQNYFGDDLEVKNHTWAIVRRPPATVANGITTEEHGKLGKPDAAATRAQHEAYVTALRRAVGSVFELPPDDRYPDSHYVQDTAAVLGNVAVIANMMKESRKGDVLAVEDFLRGTKEIIKMPSYLKIEFGDVVPLGERGFLLGVSERTSKDAASYFSEVAKDVAPSIEVHIVPFNGVLHLGTGLSALNNEVLLKDPNCHTDFDLGKIGKVIMLPPDEGYAANFRTVNGMIILPQGYQKARDIASQYYQDDKIVTLDMSQFQMMNGSVTCLSILDLLRPI
jgi:dimethylargininase